MMEKVLINCFLNLMTSLTGHFLLLKKGRHNQRFCRSIQNVFTAEAKISGRYSGILDEVRRIPNCTSAAEVALVHLNLTVQLTAFKFRHMIDRFAELLVDTGDRLIIQSKIMRETVRWLMLVESLHNGDLRTNPFHRLLFSISFVPAPDVSATGPGNLERTAENTLSTLQKVGRTTENVLSSLYHMGILTPHGYETH